MRQSGQARYLGGRRRLFVPQTSLARLAQVIHIILRVSGRPLRSYVAR